MQGILQFPSDVIPLLYYNCLCLFSRKVAWINILYLGIHVGGLLEPFFKVPR